MIQFLENWGIAILTIAVIFILIMLPYDKIFKEYNYNSKDSFMEGYSSAENEIKKGKDATTLFNQCQGVEDNWDRGWVQACSNYKLKKK